MSRQSPVVDTQTALAATTNSPAIEVPGGGLAAKVGVFIDVSAVGGTPTLDVALEYSLDGGTTWAADEVGADSFAQITATGQSFKTFDVKARHYRLAYTVGGGTPSLTFTVRHYPIG